jgi:spermidine synthase
VEKTHQAAEQRILLFSIFVVSLCGIIYELVLGSLATYLLGNPVVQYSITIGFFLSSMGLGSFISRFVTGQLVRTFIMIELILGFIGGLSVLVLNIIFSMTAQYYLVHVLFLVMIGTLVGMEIPLLTRILKRYGSLKIVISNVLSIDYIGGLAGSLLFPLLLFPFTGRFVACALTGIANIVVALAVILRIEYEGRRRRDILFPVAGIILLTVGIIFSGQISRFLQSRLYADDIVFSKRSKYQEIVLTRNADDFRLFLDGSIQFSTSDEYRYHEMLIQPVMSVYENQPADILVMGGGDGMALREILRHTDVRSVTLVELDPLMIDLATRNSTFTYINRESLTDPRVKVIVGDAYQFLRHNDRRFDIIVADFSDPHDETIAKLYTNDFYRLVKRSLAADGLLVTQATSPLSAREAFWCIRNSLADVFPTTVPYHILVPSFGDWGFIIATGRASVEVKDLHDLDMRFYNTETFRRSCFFENDCMQMATAVNTFDRPILYRYYLRGWKYVD